MKTTNKFTENEVIKLFNEQNIYETTETNNTTFWIDDTKTCGYIVTTSKTIETSKIEKLKEKGITITCIEVARDTNTIILYWML